MQVTIKGPDNTGTIWNHFLLKGAEVTIYSTDRSNRTATNNMIRLPSGFLLELAADVVTIEMVVRAVYRYNGTDYSLLQIFQSFQVTDAGLVASRWYKIRPDQAKGFPKGAPPLHPLLRVQGGDVTVALEFVDITKLFYDIHSDTPWYKALELLRGTPRIIRVLAALRGHPLIWYVVIPDSVANQSDLQPNLLYFPADYGGISYVADRIEGITTPNHNTSIGKIQCGGETLFSFLTNPVSDEQYNANLQSYLSLTKRFEKRAGRNPPPLHHFREVLSYHITGGNLVPDFWDVPFGFEQALSDKRQILFIPQVNNGDAGIAIRDHLKDLVKSAIFLIYSQGNTLTQETISVNNLILTCYSQSGGNVFTAAGRNPSDIKALICFEPQYMNRYLDREDKSLMLGKDVIPLLIRQGIKVVIAGRHKQGWEGKYLPIRFDPAQLILLPDDAHYAILDYPDSSKPYDPNASPVLARRYSRLLKNTADPVISAMLSAESGAIDFASAEEEAKIEEIIGKYRKAGFTDEKMIKTVFTSNYNIDVSGGFYTHNLIVSSGQDLNANGSSILRYFNQALNLIG